MSHVGNTLVRSILYKPTLPHAINLISIPTALNLQKDLFLDLALGVISPFHILATESLGIWQSGSG